MFDVLETNFGFKMVDVFYFQCSFYELMIMNCKLQDTLSDFIELLLV